MLIFYRTEAIKNGETDADRQARGRRHFDILWTPAAAQANREKNFKYQPDLRMSFCPPQGIESPS